MMVFPRHRWWVVAVSLLAAPGTAFVLPQGGLQARIPRPLSAYQQGQQQQQQYYSADDGYYNGDTTSNNNNYYDQNANNYNNNGYNNAYSTDVNGYYSSNANGYYDSSSSNNNNPNYNYDFAQQQQSQPRQANLVSYNNGYNLKASKRSTFQKGGSPYDIDFMNYEAPEMVQYYQKPPPAPAPPSNLQYYTPPPRTPKASTPVQRYVPPPPAPKATRNVQAYVPPPTPAPVPPNRQYYTPPPTSQQQQYQQPYQQRLPAANVRADDPVPDRPKIRPSYTVGRTGNWNSAYPPPPGAQVPPPLPSKRATPTSTPVRQERSTLPMEVEFFNNNLPSQKPIPFSQRASPSSYYSTNFQANPYSKAAMTSSLNKKWNGANGYNTNANGYTANGYSNNNNNNGYSSSDMYRNQDRNGFSLGNFRPSLAVPNFNNNMGSSRRKSLSKVSSDGRTRTWNLKNTRLVVGPQEFTFSHLILGLPATTVSGDTRDLTNIQAIKTPEKNRKWCVALDAGPRLGRLLLGVGIPLSQAQRAVREIQDHLSFIGSRSKSFQIAQDYQSYMSNLPPPPNPYGSRRSNSRRKW